MAEGTSIQAHLNKFNSIIIDLENLDIKIKDEDKTVLLIVSLPPSYKHFKEIMLYDNHDTLSFEDVKASLLSKEKFDLEVHSKDKVEGLHVRGRTHGKVNNHKRNSRSKSRGYKANTTCRYCKKPGHEIFECYKLKNKKEKEEKSKQPQKNAEASFIEIDSEEGDPVLLISSSSKSLNE